MSTLARWQLYGHQSHLRSLGRLAQNHLVPTWEVFWASLPPELELAFPTQGPPPQHDLKSSWVGMQLSLSPKADSCKAPTCLRAHPLVQDQHFT